MKSNREKELKYVIILEYKDTTTISLIEDLPKDYDIQREFKYEEICQAYEIFAIKYDKLQKYLNGENFKISAIFKSRLGRRY